MSVKRSDDLIVVERIEPRILLIRGQRVILDADLAELYGATTKALNQAVKRNQERFPSDFRFELMAAEKQEVVTNCDHLARLRFSRTLPYAFTEHGALMAASILNTPQPFTGDCPNFRGERVDRSAKRFPPRKWDCPPCAASEASATAFHA